MVNAAFYIDNRESNSNKFITTITNSHIFHCVSYESSKEISTIIVNNIIIINDETIISEGSRGSLEVFNPTSNSNSPVRSPANLKTWTETEEVASNEISDEVATNTSWMAIKEEETGTAAQRAAKWGLVLTTDAETGKPQGVAVRNSGDDEPGGKFASK
ncbi:non-specific serine/threonine protein kinase [Trifolium repens]|nr:non-specific serine/threonine protein kinase [Trifolium repens]